MTTALGVGVVLALACLAYVLYPLLAHARAPKSRPLRVVTDDEIEAAIRAYRASLGSRACPLCGPRPEADAVFCSACGRRLDGLPTP